MGSDWIRQSGGLFRKMQDLWGCFLQMNKHSQSQMTDVFYKLLPSLLIRNYLYMSGCNCNTAQLLVLPILTFSHHDKRCILLGILHSQKWNDSKSIESPRVWRPYVWKLTTDKRQNLISVVVGLTRDRVKLSCGKLATVVQLAVPCAQMHQNPYLCHPSAIPATLSMVYMSWRWKRSTAATRAGC